MKMLDNGIINFTKIFRHYIMFFLICYIIHIKNKYSALLSSQLLGLKGNIYITETEKSLFYFLPLPKVTTKGKMDFAFKLVPFYTI